MRLSIITALLISLTITFQSRLALASMVDPDNAFHNQAYQQAEELYRQKLTRYPNDHRLHYNLGVTLYQQHRFEEAQQQFNQAASTDDLSLRSQALFNRGMAQFMQGSYQATVESWQEALSYQLDDERIAENLQWLLEQLEENERDQEADEPTESSPDGDTADDENLAEQEASESDSSEEQQSSESESLAESDSQDASESESMAESDSQDANDRESGDDNQMPDEQGEEESYAGQEESNAESPEDELPEGETLAEQQASEPQPILSPQQVEAQDAERLIRSVEDQLGRFSIPIDRETMRQRRGENAW